MADSRTSKSSDGLIYPPGIPTDDLKPESITSAADALDLVAGKVSASADGVDTAWTPISASFVAPDAQIVYGGMAPATASTRTVASKLTKVAAALRTYGQELVAVKKSLEAVKSEAAKWLASDFDSENRVWVLAHRTKAYEWDIQVSKVNIVTDPFEYLRGRGETVRAGWFGYPEIRAYWRESGDHVERNNELLDKVADAYAKLNALQVECANAINALRDTAGEKLKAIDAEALKIGGEHAADLPWGKQAEHERTCTENFGQGLANTAISLTNLVGVNYERREWSWTWETFGNTWGGLLDGANSLIATVNPVVWGLALLGDKEAQKLWGDSSAKSLEMLKGIVSWDKWFTNPAEAAGEVALGFVPIVGWAGKSSKLGTVARTLVRDSAEAVAKRAAAVGARIKLFFDEHRNPKPSKVDMADGVKGPHVGEGPRVEVPDRNGSQAPHVERGGETGGGPKHDGDSAGQGSPGHREGDSGNGPGGQGSHASGEHPSGGHADGDGSGKGPDHGNDGAGHGSNEGGPKGETGTDHPSWKYEDPQVQDLKNALEDAVNQRQLPGYDPTGGLGWKGFFDEYLFGIDGSGRPQWNWPKDPPHTNGFFNGVSKPNDLQVGDRLERITFLDKNGQAVNGGFAAPPGTKFDQLALPPDRLSPNTVTVRYEVLKALPEDIRMGEIARGFGQRGGGLQYYFPEGIQILEDLGYIKEI